MSEPFLAEIRQFGFNFAPRGWAQCDGQILPINQNQSLFSLLGTTYGGDGRTSFGLPDLRGRNPLHVGPVPFNHGRKGGAESVALSVAEMPNHTHTAQDAKLHATPGLADTNYPGGNTLAAANVFSGDPPSVDMSPDSASNNLANAGSSQSHANLPPVLAINFCIAITGLFPSRN
jgi:microcystin-dependent protein